MYRQHIKRAPIFIMRYNSGRGRLAKLAYVTSGIVAVICCVGCRSDRAATYPVSGTVRFEDGQPVPAGVIEFRPEGGGVSARAKLDREGKYRLGTFEVNDGAAEGAYRVVIVQHFNVPPAAAASRLPPEHQAHGPHAEVRVADAFTDYATSPLRAAVERDATNQFDYVVSRRRAAKHQGQSVTN